VRSAVQRLEVNFGSDLNVARIVPSGDSAECAAAAVEGTVAHVCINPAGIPVVEGVESLEAQLKTNAFGKSDLQACQHVFLSAVIELQDRARKEGGNAVVNIKSNYRNELTESPTEFTCGAGAVIAGVALVGDVVTLKGR